MSDTKFNLKWLAGPNQKVRFINALAGIGIPAMEAFKVARGDTSITLTSSQADQFIKGARAGEIESTSYQLTPVEDPSDPQET